MSIRLFGMVVLLAAAPALAHETDQFAIPVGQEMAEMGPYLSNRVADIVEKAVNGLNAQIHHALDRKESGSKGGVQRRGGNRPGTRQVQREPDPEVILARAHSPKGVADAVYRSFGPALSVIESLQADVNSKAVKEKYPDQLTSYQAKTRFGSVYNKAYLPIDPRNIPALLHAPTFKTFGVYQGTDKLGHFSDIGWHYFNTYRDQIDKGATEEEAMAKAVKIGSKGIFSEGGLLGTVMVGSYSNADLVANYTGCLFYRNLTEPVIFKGRLYEPILVRDGEYWKFNDKLDRDTFFERCISDHLNEALNPSLYDPVMRGAVRRFVEEHNAELLAWYADKYGNNDPEKYFTQLVYILSTYYGADYGHSDKFEDLIHLGNTIAPSN